MTMRRADFRVVALLAKVMPPPYEPRVAIIAILFEPGETAETLGIAGGTSLERLRREAERAGCARTLIHRASATFVATEIADDDAVLVLAAGIVVDPRAVAAVLATRPPAVAAWSTPPDGSYRGVERIDATYGAAGIAVYPGAMVRRIVAAIGEWDLHSTLLRTALSEGGCRIVDLATVPDYVASIDRAEPLVWALPETAAAAAAITAQLIDAAQPSPRDWPAVAYAPLQRRLLRLALITRVSPLVPMLLTIAVGLGAMYATAAEWPRGGLLLALLASVMTGVDASLARLTLQPLHGAAAADAAEIGIDAGFFMAIAAHLAATDRTATGWAVAAALILFAVAEGSLRSFYERFTGARLDKAGRFEWQLGRVASRRNTRLWLLVPFAVAGAWSAGLLAVAAFAVASYFVTGWRAARRLLAARA